MAVAAVARPAGAPAGVGPDQSAAASDPHPRPPGMNHTVTPMTRKPPMT